MRAMGVTLVLRGDDHLANTPRQLLILEALGLPVPRYGHLPLLLGADGTPLSKRDGAAGLHDLREQGYLPGALCNYLVRLGHACAPDEWLEAGGDARAFRPAAGSRSAARFDEAQLRHWQREAVHGADRRRARWRGWARGSTPLRRRRAQGRVRRRRAWQPAVSRRRRAPGRVVCERTAWPGADAQAAIADAGPSSSRQAADEWASNGGRTSRHWTRAVRAATGRKGAALYQPLRAALTGMHPRARSSRRWSR